MLEQDDDRPMSEDEWWDGFDRELSQVLVGMTGAHLASIIVAVAAAATGLLFYVN